MFFFFSVILTATLCLGAKGGHISLLLKSEVWFYPFIVASAWHFIKAVSCVGYYSLKRSFFFDVIFQLFLEMHDDKINQLLFDFLLMGGLKTLLCSSISVQLLVLIMGVISVEVSSQGCSVVYFIN